MKKLVKVYVQWDKSCNEWEVVCAKERVSAALRKRDAIEIGRKTALRMQPASLIIRKRNGEFQTEYTYPRSSDPRKSRG